MEIEKIVSDAIQQYQESLKFYFPELKNKLPIAHTARFLAKFFNKKNYKENKDLKIGDEVVFIYELTHEDYKTKYIITGLKPNCFYINENCYDTSVQLKNKWPNDTIQYTSRAKFLQKVN